MSLSAKYRKYEYVDYHNMQTFGIVWTAVLAMFNSRPYPLSTSLQQQKKT